MQFASFVTVDPRSLRFPAGRLVVGGVYTIRVRGEMERNADLANVVDYMVRVVSAGLSASISGAQVRRMSRFVEFDLDASESQDLDGLDGVPMAFSWTCARTLPDELVPVYDEPCSPLAWDVTDVIGTDAVLLVPAEMPVGAYRFAVTVTKGEDGLKLPFALRSSTDYVVVTLVDARIPTVTVSALADVVFVGGTAVVNTGSKPILEAAVSPGKACCGARRSCRCCRNERCGVSFNRVLAVSGFEVEGSWSVDNVDEDTLSKAIVTPTSQLLAGLGVDNLPTGSTFVFRFTATLAGTDISNSGSIALLVNAPPSGGVVTVFPKSGACWCSCGVCTLNVSRRVTSCVGGAAVWVQASRCARCLTCDRLDGVTRICR